MLWVFFAVSLLLEMWMFQNIYLHWILISWHSLQHQLLCGCWDEAVMAASSWYSLGICKPCLLLLGMGSNILLTQKKESHTLYVWLGPVVEVLWCENMACDGCLQACLCSFSLYCPSNSITGILSMACCEEVPLCTHPKVFFMVKKIGKVLEIFILWRCPIWEIVNLLCIWAENFLQDGKWRPGNIHASTRPSQVLQVACQRGCVLGATAEHPVSAEISHYL